MRIGAGARLGQWRVADGDVASARRAPGGGGFASAPCVELGRTGRTGRGSGVVQAQGGIGACSFAVPRVDNLPRGKLSTHQQWLNHAIRH